MCREEVAWKYKPMNFISTFNTEVERRRTIGREGDTNAVVVAYFGSLRGARVRTHVPLAQKGD